MAVIYKASEKDKEKRTRDKLKVSSSKNKNKKKPKDRDGSFYDIVHKIRSGAGLSVEPKGVNFADKDKDEEALVVLRRHPVTNLPWLIFSLLMVLAVLPAIHFGWLSNVSTGLQTTLIYAWLVLALLVSWSGLLTWYFNVSVISSKRVIDIDFHDLIYREVSDANLDKIEDVTHNMGGLFGIIFNFGDVYIQTAGAKPTIEFLKVPHPAEVASTLRKLREEAAK
ncbi:MAG: Uncharacterized protein XD98_0387 [Microgenomates bacterium 39_6]|nr:MAG: Uncharacterized protein XD98_0387 [Microgenomates bacterium 39_6]